MIQNAMQQYVYVQNEATLFTRNTNGNANNCNHILYTLAFMRDISNQTNI